jgi:EmrB/QacA subfamily drug resistance transporter
MGYRIIALTVSTALFIVYLDSAAFVVAIPAMAREFHVPAVNLNVAILANQLSMTVLIPVGSVIAERIGQRNAFVIALCVFIAGSVLCALSTSLPGLVAARALQGAGGAVMMPVSRVLVIRSADKSELLNALNWLLLPSIIGPMLGPVIGGQLVTYGNWHWIFLVNVPVALLGAVMTMIVVPDIREDTRGRVDAIGILLSGVAILTLMFGLDSAAHPRSSWEPPALLISGLVFLWLFLKHVRATTSPVLDISLMRIASFRHSIVAGAIIRTVLIASGFVVPLWFQLGMGMSAAKAGSILVISTMGVIVSRLAGVRLAQVVHPRNMAIGGALLLVLALIAIAQMKPDWPLWAFYAVLGFQAIVFSLSTMVVNAVTYVDIEPDKVGQASNLYSMVQQLNMSLGVTLGVWLISGMRLAYSTGEHDGRIYSASMMILAVVALFGAASTSRLDVHSTGTLRASRS